MRRNLMYIYLIDECVSYLCVCTFLYILRAVCHHVQITLFFYLIFIYSYSNSRVSCLPSHFTFPYTDVTLVIINLKEIPAFSPSTRCPLTRNITSFCRVLYFPCVMYSRMYTPRVFSVFAFSRSSEGRRISRFTIPDSYRKARCLCNS